MSNFYKIKNRLQLTAHVISSLWFLDLLLYYFYKAISRKPNKISNSLSVQSNNEKRASHMLPLPREGGSVYESISHNPLVKWYHSILMAFSHHIN